MKLEPVVWKVECNNKYSREVSYVLARNAKTAEKVALCSFPIAKRQFGEPRLTSPARIIRGG